MVSSASVCPALAAFFALASSSPIQGQTSSRSVTFLLEHSEVESMLSGFRDDIEGELVSLGVDLSAEILAALNRHLSVEALLPVMASLFEAQGDGAMIDAAASLVEGGAIARVDEIIDASDPSVTVGEYLEMIRADPPPRARIQLVARMVSAQAAGDFFVLISERTKEAAYLIAEAVSTGNDPFEPLTEERWVEQAERNFNGALVSFLHRYDPVSDSDLADALSDWTSDPGGWYISAYSLALGETALAAARAIAEEIRD